MSYNCRVYDYPTGLHVSLYDKTNTKKDIQENENDNENNFKKSYKNEERTTEQEEHCIEQSLSKTKNTIYNLARSNIWEYFITLTFDGKITDRSSYDEVTKKLQNFLENLRKRKCPDLIYLIVPEFHLDGINYHFHGLIANTNGMHIIPSGKFTKDGKKIYKIKDWKIGWTTAIKVYDTVGASSYITKYTTKQTCVFLKNKKRYYASQNINRTEAKYCIADKHEILDIYEKDIAYIKSVRIKESGQGITYLEIPNKEFERPNAD